MYTHDLKIKKIAREEDNTSRIRNLKRNYIINNLLLYLKKVENIKINNSINFDDIKKCYEYVRRKKKEKRGERKREKKLSLFFCMFLGNFK